MNNLTKFYDEETEEWGLSLNYLGIPFFSVYTNEKDRDWAYDYLTKHPGFISNPVYTA